MKRALTLAAASLTLAGCALFPVSVTLQDFSLDVNDTTAGRICYQEVNHAPQPQVGSLTVSGVARYPKPAGAPVVDARFDFFARTTSPGSGSLVCVSGPTAADQQVGSVSITRGGPDRPYTLAGASLTEGVRAGRYWIGASVANSGSFLGGILGDYGTVRFEGNVATVTLR